MPMITAAPVAAAPIAHRLRPESAAHKILLAAALLPEEGFTASDLVVKAWQTNPQAFGLAGFRESYPDANKVLSYCMGKRGLVARGYLDQHGRKCYRLSGQGALFVGVHVKWVVGVAVRTPPPPPPPPATFAEAMKCWGITEDSPTSDVENVIRFRDPGVWLRRLELLAGRRDWRKIL